MLYTDRNGVFLSRRDIQGFVKENVRIILTDLRSASTERNRQ